MAGETRLQDTARQVAFFALCGEVVPMSAMFRRVVVVLFWTGSFLSAQPLVDLHRMLPDGGSKLAVLADFDGDSDLDLLRGTRGLDVFLNDGGGSFVMASVALPSATPRQVHCLDVGDVDGDGDLDVLVGVSYIAHAPNQLLLNDGSGVFTPAPPQHVPQRLDWPSSVALGDVDVDGDLDALIGAYPETVLWRNGGNGVFGVDPLFPVGLGWAHAVAFGDVESDGDLDIWLGYYGQDRLLLNDGSGLFAFAPPGSVPADADETERVAFADVDADGDLDLVLLNRDVNVRLYRNDGSGIFRDDTAGMPVLPGEGKGALLVLDADGDGDLDVLLGTEAGERLLLNDGTGRFVDVTSASLPDRDWATEWIAAGDVDGDADVDVVCCYGSRLRGDRLELNDGFGAFTDVTTPELTVYDSYHPSSIAAVDLDEDGDLDVFECRSPAPDRVLRNDGRGFLSDASLELLPSGSSMRRAVFGDLDGDGDYDLLGSREITAEDGIVLYLNTGDGVLIDSSDLLPAAGSAWDLELADIDRDGDLDAFLPIVGGNIELWRNNGHARFRPVSRAVPAAGELTFAIASGDLDGDGDLDLLAGNRGALNALYLNDGHGRFSVGGSLPPHVDGTENVVLADVDGDGDLDVYVANFPESHRLYLNDGRAVFVDATSRLPPYFDVQGMFVDFDEDGDPDLDLDGTLCVNDGRGFFTAMPGFYSGARLWADLDGDGDPDGFAHRAVRFNPRRQLAWRAMPRVGQLLELDVYGMAGEPFVLGFAFAVTPVAPPPGRVRLAGGGGLASWGALDGTGRACYALRVPRDPTLVGLAVHWQAALFLQWRLTNFETTLLTGL